ncbi:MAG: cell wall hydrolase [Alphaproteobacteria bacterium]|nr:cell wall hydrolase [Alphaproteobacteria bacterium]
MRGTDEEMNYFQELEADTLARTIWGEARGEGTAGMQAVAAVVMNRVQVARERGTYWWGNSIVQVCQKPYQFSCWNRDDANFRKVLAVDLRDRHFAAALQIARRAVAGRLDDPTGGATHYHAAGISPAWIKGETQTAAIGRHIFYRLQEV